MTKTKTKTMTEKIRYKISPLSMTKGQIKQKAVWARHRFFQKTNKRI